MSAVHRPLALIILDGWGYTEDDAEGNAISQAPTPNWDRLWREYPHTFLHASELEVGLPPGQMGNSEVGHMNLGAGRVIYQDYTRIERAIETGEFFRNPVLCEAVDKAVARHKAVHVFGLLSPGGVHSHEDHIEAMLRMAEHRRAEEIYLHAFLDGRDTPPKSAAESLRRIEDLFHRMGNGRIASIMGRYYAMDRDHRWDRVQQAYRAIAEGRAKYRASNALSALEQAYARGETDEFVKPTLIECVGDSHIHVEDGDSIIFMNFRADRAREITSAFIEESFHGFARSYQVELGAFVCLTRYHKDFPLPVAYPPEHPENVFSEWISKHGLLQLHIAETEKYAHVTFFFNGGREAPFEGEKRILVPSPHVSTYDMQPEMSAQEVTDRLIASVERTDKRYDVIICNFANPDMVGHTGNFEASKQAVEVVDFCLGRVIDAVLEHGGELLITADHGNIEKMRDQGSGQAHTAHTINLVPFIYVGERNVEMSSEAGSLADVAPTMLHLLGLPAPPEMTGRSLVKVVHEEELEEEEAALA